MLTCNWVHNIRYYYCNIRAWNSCWSSDIVRSTLKLVLPIANTTGHSVLHTKYTINTIKWPMMIYVTKRNMFSTKLFGPRDISFNLVALFCCVSSSMINNRNIQRKYAKYRKGWTSTCIWKLSTHVLRYKHCITAAMIFIYSVQFVECKHTVWIKKNVCDE